MFGRVKQPEPEPGRDRRQVERGASNPAFSYYASRRPEVTADRRQNRTAEQATDSKPSSFSRLPRSVTQVPYWLLIAVAAVCVVKVLYLTTDPKIIVLGKTTVSSTYMRTNAVYEAAAQRQLAGGIANHSKLSVNLNGTAAALQRQFPELQAVSMTVPLVSNRPIVYVQIAQPSAVLQTSLGNYALNSSGVVLAAVHTVPTGVPMVSDQTGGKPVPGKQYLPGSTMQFIRTAAYQLAAGKQTISTFVLPSASLYELDVRLEGQPYLIKYNLQGDPLLQSGAAVAAIAHLGSTVPQQYMDVRVSGRVYYR